MTRCFGNNAMASLAGIFNRCSGAALKRWFMHGKAGSRAHRISPIWVAAIVGVGLAGCSGTGFAPGDSPDLVVTAPSVNDSGPAAGATFTLSATVQNAGGESSEPTTWRFYRSTDATITTSDTAVGTAPLAGLAASGTSSQLVILTAPSTPGTYYYGACVDAVAGESDTTDNCSSSVRITVPRITVPEPQSGPDPVVAASVSDNGPAAGATFTLSATVRNAGNEASAATTLRFYASTDATITTSDTEVGTDAVAALDASETSSQLVILTAPSTPGTYYYGACVDAVAGESDTSNNCSLSVRVEVVTSAASNLLPGAPTSFRHECGPPPGCTTVSYLWSPPTRGLPVLRYEFRDISGLWFNEAGDWPVLTDQRGDVELLAFYATVTNGTFTVRVRAVNEHGTGPEASLTFTLPPEEYQEHVAPTQVINLSANCIQSCDRVGLSWDPPGTGRPITRYEVWATDHPEWQSATADEFGNPDDSFRYNDDVWDEGTYEYKVRASNPHGTGPEASVSIERN